MSINERCRFRHALIVGSILVFQKNLQGHKNLSCPDLQDSVYFTPTSDTPFDPFEVTCLSKDKWKITKHDYKNFEDRRGIGYQCFYTRDDVTAPWEKEFGIY